MTPDTLGALTVFLNVDMKAFVTKMQLAKGEISGLNKAILASSAVFKKVGRQFMIAGAVIVGAFALTVKAAADFETSMAKVNTMLTKSTEHYLPKFAKQIHNLSMKYGQSTKVLADATYDILSAQIDASKAMDLLAVASEAAAGGFTTVSTTTSAIITLMSTFGDQLRDSADAADWLAAVVERGRVTMEDVASTIGQTAAMAAKARMSIEDYGAAFAMLTRGGLDAHKAQTALRGILRSVLKTSDEAILAARELGVEWGVDALSAENFEDTLQKLAKGSVEQLAAISPNIRGLLGWAIAAGQAGKAGKDLDVITNRLGLSHEKYLKVQDTTTLKFNQMKQTIIASAVVIGNKLLPVVKKLVDAIADSTKKIIDFADAHPKLFSGIVQLTAALGALLVLLGGLASIIPNIVAACNVLAKLIPILKGVTASAASASFAVAGLGVSIAGLGVGWALGRLINQIFDVDSAVTKLTLKIIDLSNYLQNNSNAQKEHNNALKQFANYGKDSEEALYMYHMELAKGKTIAEASLAVMRKFRPEFKSQIESLEELTKKEEEYDEAIKRRTRTLELKSNLKTYSEKFYITAKRNLDKEHKQRLEDLSNNNLILEEEELRHLENIKKIKDAGGEDVDKRLAKENIAHKKALDSIKTTNKEIILENMRYREENTELFEKYISGPAEKRLKAEIDATKELEDKKLAIIKKTNREINAVKDETTIEAINRIEEEGQELLKSFTKLGLDTKLVFEWVDANLNKITDDSIKANEKLIENNKKLTQSFLEVIDPQRAAYAQLAEEMKKIEETDLTTLEKAQYLAKRKAEIEKDAIDETYDYYKEASERTYNAISDSFKTLFLDAFEGNLKTARDYFNAFASSVKSIVADILAQTVAMKLLGLNGTGGLLGGLFHSGGVVKKHMGGIIKAHNGMAITADEVPIIAQTGEGVLSRLGMDALGGKSALDNLNRGNPTQTKQEIHRHYYINAMDAKSFKDFLNNNKQSLEDVISDSFDENSTLRRL
jgi:TP901 family phage tail tape measure protein